MPKTGAHVVTKILPLDEHKRLCAWWHVLFAGGGFEGAEKYLQAIGEIEDDV